VVDVRSQMSDFRSSLIATFILFKMAAFRGVGKMFQTISLIKIFNELYLFSMDFALCLTLGIFASLVNAFFLVHDSENPKFGSLNSRTRS
jgi:hypothetical protein